MTLEHRSAVSVKRGFRIAASVWRMFLLADISPSLSISLRPVPIPSSSVWPKSGTRDSPQRQRQPLPTQQGLLQTPALGKSPKYTHRQVTACDSCPILGVQGAMQFCATHKNVHILVITHLNKGHVQSLHSALSYLIVPRDRRQDLVR
jgi:hypothetical protein